MNRIFNKLSLGFMMLGLLFVLSCGATEESGLIISPSDDEELSGGDSAAVVLALDHEFDFLELMIGDTLTLNSLVTGFDDDTDWALFSDSLVSLNIVDNVGVVTGKSEGQVLLRAIMSEFEFGDDSVTGSLEVQFISINVVPEYSSVVGIEMSESDIVFMSHVDGVSSSQLTVSALVSPLSLLQSAIEWETTNSDVIDFGPQFGKYVRFQSQGRGEADVIVRSLFDSRATDSVHVVVGRMDSFLLNTNLLELSSGSTGDLTLAILPSGFDSTRVSWSVDHPNIANLDAFEDVDRIVVTGLSPGTTVVRARSKLDGSIVDSVIVRVSAPPVSELQTFRFNVSSNVQKYHLLPIDIDYEGDLSGGITWTQISGPVASVNVQNELLLLDPISVIAEPESVIMQGTLNDDPELVATFSVLFNPVALSELELSFSDEFGTALPPSHSAHQGLFSPHIFEFSFDPGQEQVIFTGLNLGGNVSQHVLVAVLDEGADTLEMRVPQDEVPGMTLYESSAVHESDLWMVGSGDGQFVVDKLFRYDPDGDSWFSEDVVWDPRFAACMFSYNGDLYMSGGTDFNVVFRDLWKRSSGTWSPVAVNLDLPIFLQGDYEDFGGCVVHEETVFMYGSTVHDFRVIWSDAPELDHWDEAPLDFVFQSNWISSGGRLWAAQFDQIGDTLVNVTLFTSFDGLTWEAAPESISFLNVADNLVSRVKLFTFGDRVGVALDTLSGQFTGLKFLE